MAAKHFCIGVNFNAPIAQLDLSGRGLTSVPGAVLSLSGLSALSLARNQLTALPHNFANLTRLKALDLSHNKFAKAPTVLKHMRPPLHDVTFAYNPFMASFPCGLDGMAVFAYMREQAQNCPRRCLEHTPAPLPFHRERFYTEWFADERRLFGALVAMLRNWGLKAPVTDAKWEYLQTYVFDLALVWGEKDRFATLQDCAADCRAAVARACAAVLAEHAELPFPRDHPLTNIERATDRVDTEPRCNNDDGGGWDTEARLPAALVAFGRSFLSPRHRQNAVARVAFPAMLRALAEAAYDEWNERVHRVFAACAAAPRVLCERNVSIKSISRIAAKMRNASAVGGAESTPLPPWTHGAARVVDALRATVLVRTTADLVPTWRALRSSFRVVRVKNKFMDPSARFPNIHTNVLFRAAGCPPLVAEIQVHLEDVHALAQQDHRLYEVARATSIGDLALTTATARFRRESVFGGAPVRVLRFLHRRAVTSARRALPQKKRIVEKKGR